MITSTFALTRLAADGARLTIDLPVETGTLEWHGHTRIAAPGLLRAFSLAPAGHSKAVPTHIFPGGRAETFRRRGYDLRLYEAADRSNSCLIWAGPYHEATTWFNGPAPRQSVLNSLAAAIEFADGPEGAKVTPRLKVGTQQFGTSVFGISDRVLIMALDARTARESLPDWQGMARGDVEVWKDALALDPEQKAALTGTPYEWRYTFASPTAVFTVMFPKDGTEAAALRNSRDQAMVDAVLGGVRVEWAA
ncbi:hypothetical protein AB0I81_05865 [Nonomuraea sp. NPDC050404]|uniref:hypothetical protein n=1 Tax=Nonomuraea sp. NPDC050404 TaxID=3155783 RepID=UPI0034051946